MIPQTVSDENKKYLVSFRIGEEYAEKIDALARKDKRTRSSTIYKIVTDFLDEVKA